VSCELKEDGLDGLGLMSDSHCTVGSQTTHARKNIRPNAHRALDLMGEQCRSRKFFRDFQERGCLYPGTKCPVLVERRVKTLLIHFAKEGTDTHPSYLSMVAFWLRHVTDMHPTTDITKGSQMIPMSLG
jgi:hypothetical protein